MQATIWCESGVCTQHGHHGCVRLCPGGKRAAVASQGIGNRSVIQPAACVVAANRFRLVKAGRSLSGEMASTGSPRELLSRGVLNYRVAGWWTAQAIGIVCVEWCRLVGRKSGKEKEPQSSVRPDIKPVWTLISSICATRKDLTEKDLPGSKFMTLPARRAREVEV